MDVASFPALLFWPSKRSSSSFCSSAARPVARAASNAFMVGGFTDVRWGEEIDVFSGSRHESDAAEFETRGVTFAAKLA